MIKILGKKHCFFSHPYSSPLPFEDEDEDEDEDEGKDLG